MLHLYDTKSEKWHNADIYSPSFVTYRGPRVRISNQRVMIDDDRFVQFSYFAGRMVVWDYKRATGRWFWVPSSMYTRGAWAPSLSCSFMAKISNDSVVCVISGVVFIFDYEKGEFSKLDPTDLESVSLAGVFSDNKLLIQSDSGLALWDLNSREKVVAVTQNFPALPFDSIAIEGDHFYASIPAHSKEGDCHGHLIYKINKNTGETENTFTSESSERTVLQMVSSRYLSVCSENLIEVYDCQTGERVRAFRHHYRGIRGIEQAYTDSFVIQGVRPAEGDWCAMLMHCTDERKDFRLAEKRYVVYKHLVPLDRGNFGTVGTDGIITLDLGESYFCFHCESNITAVGSENGVAFCEVDYGEKLMFIDLNRLVKQVLGQATDAEASLEPAHDSKRIKMS